MGCRLLVYGILLSQALQQVHPAPTKLSTNLLARAILVVLTYYRDIGVVLMRPCVQHPIGIYIFFAVYCILYFSDF